MQKVIGLYASSCSKCEVGPSPKQISTASETEMIALKVSSHGSVSRYLLFSTYFYPVTDSIMNACVDPGSSTHSAVED